MAKEEKEEKEEGAEGGGGGKKKLIIIIAAVAILVIGGGAAAFLLLSGGHDEEEAAADGAHGEAAAKDAHGAKEAKKSSGGGAHAGEMGPVFALKEPLVINVASEGGTRFCKIGLGFELDNAKMEPEMVKREALIKDVIISVISKKTPEELMTPKGQDMAKQEIMDAINDSLKDGRVTKIYFTTFLIQ